MVRNLQQKITLAEVQLQRDPEDELIREILSVAQGHLVDTLQEKVARNHQLSSASWFRYGDTCSKRFFDFHRIGRKRTPLKELKTEGGGHHGSGGPGPLCPLLLRTVVHLRGGCPRHVGSQGGLLGEHPVPSLRLGQRRANEGPDFESKRPSPPCPKAKRPGPMASRQNFSRN
jgi:hypothetical protein